MVFPKDLIKKINRQQNINEKIPSMLRPDFFLIVDLREFFFRQVRGTKSSENDQLTGHFQFVFFCRAFFFFFFFSELFFFFFFL